jgi:hypothetical protein
MAAFLQDQVDRTDDPHVIGACQESLAGIRQTLCNLAIELASLDTSLTRMVGDGVDGQGQCDPAPASMSWDSASETDSLMAGGDTETEEATIPFGTQTSAPTQDCASGTESPSIVTLAITDKETAKERAIGCRPDYEFLYRHTRGGCIMHYKCTVQGCDVVRKVTPTTPGSDWRLTEEGGPHRHAPLPRSSYPWTRAQGECALKQAQIDCRITGRILIRALAKDNLVRGVTEDQAKAYVKNHFKRRTKLDIYWHTIEDMINDLKAETDWDNVEGMEDDETLLLPTPDGVYQQDGESDDPGGWFCIPMSNKPLLGNMKHALGHLTMHFEHLTSDGLPVGKLNEPGIFVTMDGTEKVVVNHTVLLASTTNSAAQLRRIAIALVSSEVGPAVRLFIDSIQLAYRKLYAADPEPVMRWMVDSGGGNVAALDPELPEEADGRCFKHLQTNMLANKKKLKNQAHYHRFYGLPLPTPATLPVSLPLSCPGPISLSCPHDVLP